MKPNANGTIQRAKRLERVQGEGPNWVLLAGGALLSTLSIRLGCKLNQIFQNSRSNSSNNATKERGKSATRRRASTCQLHSNLYCYTSKEDGCYHCPSDVALNIKLVPTSQMSKEEDSSLPLVKIPTEEPNKDSGVMWSPSPDRLGLPQKPFHHSNSSESPCVSESGSDIYIKREVIQKLRQQLQRRDEMIMEMQSQIVDLRNSLNIEMSHSADLQSQIDAANTDLFESEREIQRLRKAIADHCVAEMGSQEKPVHANGFVNGYANHIDDVDLHCFSGGGEVRGDEEKVEMLKREVAELREVIEGKDYLLQSYKEQKVELCLKIKELQQRLASQVPNIL
ncbi:hypothetical protein ACMD2_14035 [Ananas comosus]|uniref:Uncharacterized protein n=1 Tax=Ananas comosus TaxID=4615 RepID=A0A199VVS5_ANACO|nr:hypothetical protein ACMD2_14035 [Ananas comosus]